MVPRTVENFRALCTGEKGFGYRNSKLNQVVDGEYIYAGKQPRKSIYGEAGFDRENFELKHSAPGVLSMDRDKYKKQDSRFYMFLRKWPDFDGKRVVFGQCRDMQLVKIIKPYNTVVIVNCGQL